MNNIYQLATSYGPGSILSHFPGAVRFVRDEEYSEADLHRQARIRSGDYLQTLATEIDQIAQSLAAAKAPQAPELERLVAELMAVSTDYTITRK